MAKRTRTNPVQFYLNDDEQYILDAKFKESKMKSKSFSSRKISNNVIGCSFFLLERSGFFASLEYSKFSQ